MAATCSVPLNADTGSDVASVRKALSILCAFTRRRPSWTVSALSRELDIPKSTAHNLLRTLLAFDFVEQSPVDKTYRLGPRAYELGSAYVSGSELITPAMPHLRRLQTRSGETVKLGALSGGQVLVLAAVESTQQLHTRGDVGRRWPLHSSGLGKAILSQIDDAELDRVIEERGLPRLTRHTLTDRDELREALAQIRRDGYARDWEENELGVRCISVGFVDPIRRGVHAISVSGPSVRMSAQRARDIAGWAQETSEGILEQLGRQARRV